MLEMSWCHRLLAKVVETHAADFCTTDRCFLPNLPSW